MEPVAVLELVVLPSRVPLPVRFAAFAGAFIGALEEVEEAAPFPALARFLLSARLVEPGTAATNAAARVVVVLGVAAVNDAAV